MRSVPPVVELEHRLSVRMDMWSATPQASLHEDVPRGSETPTGFDEPRALEALAAKARKLDEPEAQGGPMTLDKAMITMSRAVAKLATALNESKEASMLKWERKKPTVKMSNPAEFFNEPVTLENAYAETGAKSYRRRWAIFWPALEGRAKGTVEVELERRGLDAHAISQFDEKDYQVLYVRVPHGLPREDRWPHRGQEGGEQSSGPNARSHAGQQRAWRRGEVHRGLSSCIPPGTEGEAGRLQLPRQHQVALRDEAKDVAGAQVIHLGLAR